MPRENKSSIENIQTLKKILDDEQSGLTSDEYEVKCRDLFTILTTDYGLNKAIANLVIDRFVSGLTIKELAKQTGMSTLTIRSVLEYAVKEIKAKGVAVE